ncbi:MAG: DNA replication/repair protein RecF [Alphaproteobacteria bacterium]|nr:DNA replication/repair protein RecF [Alphaproteobacteria bacterium]
MGNLDLQLHEFTKLKSGVKRLTLTDFRNYKSLRLNTDIAPIIITGENGSGKTNILEAVSFLTPGRGLRGCRLADIKRIRTLEDDDTPTSTSWSVAADILKNDEEYTIGTALQSSEREDGESDDEARTYTYDRRIVKINQQKITQQAELGKYISAIWVTPQMDRLFLGGTQPRRSFLDRLVYAFDLEHAKRLANFEHLYRQWYMLIKSGNYDARWLKSIEADMASLGVAIAAARREQIARLNTFIEQEPDDIFPDVRLELDGTIEKMLDAKSALHVEDYYVENLAKQRNNVLYNDSVDGVNRTDFKVYFQKKGMPADLCSTGEQKALLISIILAQTKCQILNKGFAPILLLDEVTTHLDDKKRDALLDKIRNLNLQAWITSTEPQNFNLLRGEAQFFELADGRVF